MRLTAPSMLPEIQLSVSPAGTASRTVWDLVVVDEAHRTAGSQGKAWAAVHADDQVPAVRRLYFTATPRTADDDADLARSCNLSPEARSVQPRPRARLNRPGFCAGAGGAGSGVGLTASTSGTSSATETRTGAAGERHRARPPGSGRQLHTSGSTTLAGD
ncbi:hypothetical protein B6264_26520 [Kitasatospora aureofaciens]|nr:hypothetical protein B6264_26520 [Kitasatospora aureofaciens]